MESIENEIIAACKGGDWRDFGRIYDQYLPKIYQFVFYRIRHKQTAEDLSATVFLKVVQNIQSYKSDRPFVAWIYTIARNTVIDHTRTHKSVSNIEEAYDLASSDDVMGSADMALRSETLRKAMKNLTVIQQEVLTMRIWDGLSHKEIAEILKISESNSKVTFSRAVAAVKEMVPVTILLALILTKQL
jgi:RNA polymerase sigma-70 factor, ECF subfamily